MLADVVLGAERVPPHQLIKQADVLMLHHLVPDEVAPGSLGPCLDFYVPRTSLGSSLAPAVHASLLARAGRRRARRSSVFRMAARLDLDDLTHSTGGGLHLATLGGVWQALAWGFLGLSARGVDPRRRPQTPRSLGRPRPAAALSWDGRSASGPSTVR